MYQSLRVAKALLSNVFTVVVGELWLCQTLSVEMQLHFKQNPSFVTLVLFDSSHCTI